MTRSSPGKSLACQAHKPAFMRYIIYLRIYIVAEDNDVMLIFAVRQAELCNSMYYLGYVSAIRSWCNFERECNNTTGAGAPPCSFLSTIF